MLVITPDQEITIGRWQGAGYIVFDVQTGSGAYLLDGDINGGKDPVCDNHAMPLVQVIVGVVLATVLIAIIRANLPEAIAAIAILGKRLAPILKSMVLGTGMLLASQAEAASFNKNQCCENAKQKSAVTYNILRMRLDEWIANIYGLRDRGHWDEINIATENLEIYLQDIVKYCRVYPPEFDTWTATAIEGRAFVNTVPRPSIELGSHTKI
jgi:hypothetical protein